MCAQHVGATRLALVAVSRLIVMMMVVVIRSPNHASTVEERAVVIVAPALTSAAGKHVAELLLEFHWVVTQTKKSGVQVLKVNDWDLTEC